MQMGDREKTSGEIRDRSAANAKSDSDKDSEFKRKGAKQDGLDAERKAGLDADDAERAKHDAESA